MPFVAARSAEVGYAVAGEGPGLMRVHGTGGNADPLFSGSGRTTDGGNRLTGIPSTWFRVSGPRPNARYQPGS